MTRMAILSKWERPCKMANIITGIRIVCSIALLFCPLFSQAFYALYITAGISDMIDGTVAAIRAINLVCGYVMRKELVALHTVMNKVTGILLYALPLTLTFIDLKFSGAVVSAVATLAAIQEGHLIRTGK